MTVTTAIDLYDCCPCSTGQCEAKVCFGVGWLDTAGGFGGKSLLNTVCGDAIYECPASTNGWKNGKVLFSMPNITDLEYKVITAKATDKDCDECLAEISVQVRIKGTGDLGDAEGWTRTCNCLTGVVQGDSAGTVQASLGDHEFTGVAGDPAWTTWQIGAKLTECGKARYTFAKVRDQNNDPIVCNGGGKTYHLVVYAYAECTCCIPVDE